MGAERVDRRFLRVRIGIAFAILLVAACISASVTHFGRVETDRRGATLVELDTALVSVGRLSLAFDQYARNVGLINRTTLRSEIRHQADMLEVARARLSTFRADEHFAATSMRIIDQPALNPLGLLAEIVGIGTQISAGDLSVRTAERYSRVGGQLANRVLPVLTRIKNTERTARAVAVLQMERLSWIAFAISVLSLIATVLFVHLPMERTILSAHAKIAEERRAAEVASEAKTQFLATMSHEIRTPMNGVLGMAELMRASNLPAKEQSMLNVISTSGEALMEIIDDILDISKIEAGKFEIAKEPFDVSQMCDDVVRLFSGRAESKSIAIAFEAEECSAGWRRVGDAKALRQVVSNLMSNAIKFTEKGEVKLILQKSPVVQADAGAVEILVKDDGIGIPKHAQARIFESFEQADATTTRQYGGTGLGLSIVRKLVTAMGGEVTLESEEGKGTTFSVKLSLAVVPPAIELDEKPVGKPTHIRHVLVADDNEVNRMVAGSFLTRAGCKVSFSENGKEAVEMTRELQPDLVLMDGEMPVMNGPDAARAIREHERQTGRKRVAIVALSASVQARNHAEALEAGMDRYISKPLKAEELADVLATNWDEARNSS